ncbi:MAG: FxLYD domain-containing protein [Nitrosopumilaceae archaeon]
MVFALLPVSTSYSQVFDNESQLGIKLTNTQPFSYKDSDGKTVVIGELKNTKNFPITGVKVWAGFYDNNGKLLESAIGAPVLSVIPAQGTSPFIIKSNNANPAITNISVNLLGFNSSPVKQVLLKIAPDPLRVGNQVSLSGKITNTGSVDSANTKIHFISYDAFYPPRIVGVETIQLNQAIKPGASSDFEFTTEYNTRASTFKLVAESNNYLSALINVDKLALEMLTRLVTINDVSLSDVDGNKILASELSVGKEVAIQSSAWIQYATDQSLTSQPYVYYVQIKQAGERPLVEFIGMAEGAFVGPTKQFPKVSWTPQSDGLFYIETYIWDDTNRAIASPGPISLIHVKPQ